MYTGLKHFHSFVAYLALLALTIAVVHAFLAVANRRKWDGTSKKIVLFGLVSCHVQMLFGMFLYFTSPMGYSNLSGEAMGNATARLYAMEHPLVMLLAIVFITIGYSRAKRTAEDAKKYRLISRFYAIGLVLVLSRIPWSAWFA